MGTPRERIMSTAFELLYRQGYRATGINQIIAMSGVAKASFYDHFPSKDELLVEYLSETSRHEIEEMRAEVARHKSARDQFLAPMRMLKPWFDATDYRGCPFQNVLGEAPSDNPRVMTLARQHHENVRVLLRELSRALLGGTSRKSKAEADALADFYLLLLEGAIALAAAYQQPWPVERALATLETRIEK